MEGRQFVERLKKEVGKAVVGYEEVLELLAVSLLSGGHVIIEGVPGVAKTTLAKSFARATGLSFSRIQLTPDLMPADITGSVVYDPKNSSFYFRKGPIFANVVLADEINRAMPKTQSALLEAMQERQVTVEGKTYPLPDPFFLIATMNPVESEGVYRIPEAQRDRFMLKLKMEYLAEEEEMLFLKKKINSVNREVSEIGADIRDLTMRSREVRVDERILKYVHSVCSRTRQDKRILLGASPRAMEHIIFAAKSLAFLEGRSYVIPDDVKLISRYALPHRILLKAEFELDGLKPEDVVNEILEEVEVPK
ncbi:MAG: MoxR family ATPase [Archaeoglobi archaeon]|jgi:MoxR-like ATPase|nr:MoxR family ATPase [Archaeoglobi archaeon]